jgi:NTP pyrophosphatase (non-canonical NTP hydrolase)
MTPNEYQRNAMRTASEISTSCPENLLLQGVMGMSGEAGEALDIVKKIMFQGHELNETTKEHLIRELGDVLWYVATTAEALNVPLETVMQTNIDKLRARYPKKFDAERSRHREEGDT